MSKKIVNFMLFQLAWFSCVLSGVHDTTLVAVAVVLVVLLINFYIRKKHWHSDLILILSVAGMGFFLDSLNLFLDVFTLHGSPRFMFICPWWLLMLWLGFATTLRNSLDWLAGRYWLSCVLGAVAGSTSYLAGAKMGAVSINNWLFSAVILTVEWGVVMPFFVWLAHERLAKGVISLQETEDHR